MDDGYAERSGFILCTDSFTESERDLEIKTLYNNFGQECSKHVKISKRGKKKYRIYIKANYVKQFLYLVQPFIQDHFSYKLILRGNYKK